MKCLPVSVQEELPSEYLVFLKNNLQNLLSGFHVPDFQAALLVAEITGRYAEPHRFYHNLSHVFSLLKMMELPDIQIDNPAIFQLAIWYHDAVYDASRKDNEEQSATLAREQLSPFLDPCNLLFLEKMILSTARHQPAARDRDLLLFLDFDLAILAADERTYGLYASAIRKEYHRYPWLVYRQGRRRVLENFLKRPAIYFSGWFAEEPEKIARQNLQKELGGLKQLFS